MGICDGRVVIVTGSGRGIGREHALLFASEGAKLVINDLGGAPDGSGDDRTAAELVEWCRDRIAHYKCPRRVEFTEELPRHDNGKLYKHQLREQLRNQ